MDAGARARLPGSIIGSHVTGRPKFLICLTDAKARCSRCLNARMRPGRSYALTARNRIHSKRQLAGSASLFRVGLRFVDGFQTGCEPWSVAL
jgi:hypothetical protein